MVLVPDSDVTPLRDHSPMSSIGEVILDALGGVGGEGGRTETGSSAPVTRSRTTACGHPVREGARRFSGIRTTESLGAA